MPKKTTPKAKPKAATKKAVTAQTVESTTPVTPTPSTAPQKGGSKWLWIILVIIGLLVLCCVGVTVISGMIANSVKDQAGQLQDEIEENIEENNDYDGTDDGTEPSANTLEECYLEAEAQYNLELDNKCAELGEAAGCVLLENETVDIDANYRLNKLTCELIYPSESGE